MLYRYKAIAIKERLYNPDVIFIRYAFLQLQPATKIYCDRSYSWTLYLFYYLFYTYCDIRWTFTGSWLPGVLNILVVSVRVRSTKARSSAPCVSAGSTSKWCFIIYYYDKIVAVWSVIFSVCSICLVTCQSQISTREKGRPRPLQSIRRHG